MLVFMAIFILNQSTNQPINQSIKGLDEGMIDKSCVILNEISIKASLSLSLSLSLSQMRCSICVLFSLVNHCINLNQLLFPIPRPIPTPREEDSRMMMKIKKRLV